MVREVACAHARITKRVYPHLLRHTQWRPGLLALGMDITDLQRFLGHERHHHHPPLRRDHRRATLQRKFDRLTDPAAHALVSSIRQQQGDEAAFACSQLASHSGGQSASSTAWCIRVWCRRHQDTPPHHRTDADQPDFDLQDLAGVHGGLRPRVLSRPADSAVVSSGQVTASQPSHSRVPQES